MGYRTRSTSTPLPHLGQMRHRVLHAAQPSRQISHRRAVVGLVRILIDSPHPALHLRQPACTPAPGGAQASSTAQRGQAAGMREALPSSLPASVCAPHRLPRPACAPSAGGCRGTPPPAPPAAPPPQPSAAAPPWPPAAPPGCPPGQTLRARREEGCGEMHSQPDQTQAAGENGLEAGARPFKQCMQQGHSMMSTWLSPARSLSSHSAARPGCSSSASRASTARRRRHTSPTDSPCCSANCWAVLMRRARFRVLSSSRRTADTASSSLPSKLETVRQAADTRSS